MTVRSLALHGAYFDDNFGDLLLLALVGRWGRERGVRRLSYPLVPAGGDDRFERHFPDGLLGRRTLLTARGLVYAGGGHFGEPDAAARHAYGGDWDQRFLDRHVLPARAMRWLRRPHLVLGVGAGPLTDPEVRAAARDVLGRAWAVSVRDEASARFVVDDLGIGDAPLVAPDPALSLGPSHVPATAREAAARQLAGLPEGPLLGVHHPRDWLADTAPAAALRAALSRRLDEHPDVVPVVFSDNAAGEERCAALAEQVTATTGRPCGRVGFHDVWTTVALVARLDALLTTKLHVAIVAYAMGVHAESTALHPKVPRLYEQVGLPRRCRMLGDVDDDEADRAVESALAAAERGDDGVAEADRERVREAALQHNVLLGHFLDESGPW